MTTEGQKQAAKIVMYDSDEAAKKVTLTGWVSRNGRFYGDDENLARYDGCTHKQCDCGKAHEKTWTICERCRSRAEDARYEAMPFKEWDGATPLTLYDDDKYFWDKDGVLDYCEMSEVKPEELQLGRVDGKGSIPVWV